MIRTRVTIESPYAGDVDRNMIYLHRAMRDSCANGEAPLASHMLYTQFLDDSNAEERTVGIDCGLAWATHAEKMIFYTDYGISNGMHLALLFAKTNGIPTEDRQIGPN